jgi:hypothetical protein
VERGFEIRAKNETTIIPMKPDKFAEWLKSYSDAIGGPPDAEQWEAIQEVLASVEKEEARQLVKLDSKDFFYVGDTLPEGFSNAKFLDGLAPAAGDQPLTC